MKHAVSGSPALDESEAGELRVAKSLRDHPIISLGSHWGGVREFCAA
jgi:hypothetical protein